MRVTPVPATVSAHAAIGIRMRGLEWLEQPPERAVSAAACVRTARSVRARTLFGQRSSPLLLADELRVGNGGSTLAQMAKKNRVNWVASVGAEGGPLMIADISDYAKWTGAAPYAELRRMGAKYVEATKDRMRTLHYWGQFTDRLPPPFAADGGHQYIQCASEAEAQARLGELIAAIKRALPSVEVTESEDQTHILLPGEDDDLEMQVELSPKSEYDASWQANEDADAWFHDFRAVRALFWEIEGGGVAEVGRTADGSEIVLVRSWVDEDSDENHVRQLVDRKAASEKEVGELAIPSGRAVVVWSPVAPFQIEGLDGPEALMKLGETGDPPALDTEMMGGIGTIIRVKPGRYAVFIASTDDDDGDDERDWSCRWCRLTWVG